MNRMRTRFLPVIGILALAGALGRADAPAPSHADSFSKQGLFKADVNDLKDTQLVVSPDVPLAPDKNVLWCGTLQLAWNEAERLVGEKLRFTTPSAAADLLNAGLFNRADLAPDSYVAVADFERNNVEDEIRAALERTFHGAASPELIPPKPEHPGPDDFVAYAYLYKNLAFAVPFEDQSLFLPDQTEKDGYKAFGLPEHPADKMLKQIELLDYKSDNNFIVRLKTLSPDDELILAKISAPLATLQETIKATLARMASQPAQALASRDEFQMPKLNFDLRRNFKELEGLVLQPSTTAKIKGPLTVSEVKQLVRFQLNEKGAVLKSEATMVMTMSAAGGPPHRNLIFDPPFLILMKRKTSDQPYFALWIGNTTLLESAKAFAN
jgi:hypothetical protein